MWNAIIAAAAVAAVFAWLTEKPAKDQSQVTKSPEAYSLPLTTVPAPVPWRFNWYSEGQLI